MSDACRDVPRTGASAVAGPSKWQARKTEELEGLEK